MHEKYFENFKKFRDQVEADYNIYFSDIGADACNRGKILYLYKGYDVRYRTKECTGNRKKE